MTLKYFGCQLMSIFVTDNIGPVIILVDMAHYGLDGTVNEILLMVPHSYHPYSL